MRRDAPALWKRLEDAAAGQEVELPLPLEADRFSGRYRGLDLRIERATAYAHARGSFAPDALQLRLDPPKGSGAPIGGWVAAWPRSRTMRASAEASGPPGTWKLAVKTSGAKVADLVDDIVLVLDLRARKAEELYSGAAYMSEPLPVDAAHFFEFIDRPGLAVLLLSVHQRHTFSEVLARQLSAEHQGIALGTIGLVELISTGGPAVAYLHNGFQACGVSALGALPGYCLFRQAELLAWDSGLPTFAEVEVIGRSALVGLVFSGITNNLSFIGTGAAAGVRSCRRRSRLARILRSRGQRARRRPGTQSSPPPVDDVRWAYDVLGVQPTATDREVHQAWRRRRIEVHPDSAVGDAIEFERRSRISVDVNRARDIILTDRARGADCSSRAA